jgi:hypothetical protein
MPPHCTKHPATAQGICVVPPRSRRAIIINFGNGGHDARNVANVSKSLRVTRVRESTLVSTCTSAERLFEKCPFRPESASPRSAARHGLGAIAPKPCSERRGKNSRARIEGSPGRVDPFGCDADCAASRLRQCARTSQTHARSRHMPDTAVTDKEVARQCLEPHPGDVTDIPVAWSPAAPLRTAWKTLLGAPNCSWIMLRNGVKNGVRPRPIATCCTLACAPASTLDVFILAEFCCVAAFRAGRLCAELLRARSARCAPRAQCRLVQGVTGCCYQTAVLISLC